MNLMKWTPVAETHVECFHFILLEWRASVRQIIGITTSVYNLFVKEQN